MPPRRPALPLASPLLALTCAASALGAAGLRELEFGASLRARPDGATALYHAALSILYRHLLMRAAAGGVEEQPLITALLVERVGTSGPLGALGLDASGTGEGVAAGLLRCVASDPGGGPAEIEQALTRLDEAPVTPASLGALHEALLDQVATIAGDALVLTPTARGRHVTGSYYTPAPLVAWLLDSALEPALEEGRLGGEEGILALRVCDPSCGAGAFLLGAADRLVARAAPGIAESGVPDPGDLRRRVVSECMYGVDLDPLAILVCRGALWLWAGAPLPVPPGIFAHIRHGDALAGIDPERVAEGLPPHVFAKRADDPPGWAVAWRRREGEGVEPDRLVVPRVPVPAARRGEAPLRSANAWCAAFLWPRTSTAPPPPTSASLRALALGTPLSPESSALAERVATEASVLHWPIAFPEVFRRDNPGFDVVLGNPPFLNQLEAETVVSRAMAALHQAIYRGCVRAYTDRASLLLLRAARILRAPDKRGRGGRLGLVQPQSILGAMDSRAIRSELAALAPPTHVWWAGEQVFPGAAVLVVALVLRRGAPVTVVKRARGLAFTPLTDVPLDAPALAAADTWTPLVAAALGAPAIVLDRRGRLGDIACATADFRDEYYGLIPFVVDRADADEALFPRLLVTGHIDPAHSAWGARSVRFGRQIWEFPRVDRAALERGEGRLAAWCKARSVPKVLVATQTRVLEAVVDAQGRWLTSTPTISVLPNLPESDALWRVAAVLLAPPISAWALLHYGAAALAAGALKLAARQVDGLPLPIERAPWDEAAAFLATAHAWGQGADPQPLRARAALLAAGRRMVAAYGASSDIFGWWESRLPAVPVRRS